MTGNLGMAKDRIESRRAVFTAPRALEIETLEIDLGDLSPHEVVVAARRSVISPGTELAHYRGHARDAAFPNADRHGYPFHPGYAMVGDVIATGTESGLAVGDLVISHTHHQSVVRFDRQKRVCARLPAGLSPDVGPFARLAQVGGVSLQASSARPGDVVTVLGLGPVGNLAAQLAAAASYVVVGVDPSPGRRELARECGLERVVAPEEAASELARLGGARLVLECSGRAAAVVQSAELCARHGEVMAIGAPWQIEPDVPASALVARIFLGFSSFRSGSEWQFPLYDNGGGRSIFACTTWVLDRLLDGSVSTGPLVSGTVGIETIGSAYEQIVADPERYTTFLVDWEA